MRIRAFRGLCFLPLSLAIHSYVLADGPLHAVLISHRVVNTGEATAKSVLAICILPTTNRYQEVLDLQIDPPPVQTRMDAEGQKVITVDLGDIPAKETRAVRVLAWARLKPIYVDLLMTPRRQPTTLPAEIEAGELTDGWLLQLDKVRTIAEKAAAKAGSRDLDRARASFEYMTRECVYDIDDTFEPADKILVGAPASCSELAYTYVAMCRSLGIPARIVSAYVNREGVSPSTDWRTHRWAEFYSKQFGWVSADPTNRINDSAKTYFGRQDAKYLTVIDDGVNLPDGPDPAWQVFIAGETAPRSRPSAESTADAAKLESQRSAVWRVSANRTRETKLFHEACETLRSDDANARRAALTAWTHQREVMTYGYILEALFDSDRQVRRQAAIALGKSGDASLCIPLALLASGQKDAEFKAALLGSARTLLDTPTPGKRALAVAELARSRTPEALELLDGIWRDPAREVRKSAAQTLYKFGDKPAIQEAYGTLSNDEDDYIRVISALRWSRVGSVEADNLLVGMLESDVQWDREKALQELARRSNDRFAFDPTGDPKSQNNQDALGRWRSWIDARMNPTTPSVSGESPHR